MKKKLSMLIIFILVVIGGFITMNEYKKNELVKQAQKKAEEFVFRNYEKIDSVHIKKNDYHFSPMGSLLVNGYVNELEQLDFSIKYNIEDGGIGAVTSVLRATDFPPKKEECENNFCP